MTFHPTTTMQERQQAVLERVRTGESSPHALVLFLQPYISRMACRFASGRPALDRHDLISSANVAMLERAHYALAKENPFSFLIAVAKCAMIDVLRAFSPKNGPILVSLDAPAREGEEPLIETFIEEVRLEPSRTHTAQERALLQALALLPLKQRTVLMRHYGIGEHAPEPLNEIGRSLSKSGCSSTAHYQHKRGLETLRFSLEPSFPQSCVAGGAP